MRVGSAVSDMSRFDINIRAELEQVRSTSSSDEMFEWFQRLWGLAVLAHIIGNPRIGQLAPDLSWLGVITFTAGLLAIAAVVAPYDRRILFGLSLLVPATAFLEAPFLSNHWTLAVMISLALLTALLTTDSWNWFASTARSMHLVFYLFAAFAKLNSGFFDTSVSCAVVFANQSLSAAGLPTFSPTGPATGLLPVATAGIEFLIPILLLRRRTRTIGVAVALIFHGILSFDLDQHIFDFTGTLYPLFLLWLPASITVKLGRPLPMRLQIMVGSLLGVFLAASVGPPSRLALTLLTRAFFVLWIPAVVALMWWVGRQAAMTADHRYRPMTPLAWLLVGLVAFNGLTPYMELKSANGWNMYSNLAVVDGDSNHFVMRGGLPRSTAQRNPVEILSTDDPGLAVYIDSGYVLPRRNFFDYLAENPDAIVEYRQDGRVRTATGAEIGVEMPLLMEKFALLRAIDLQQPPRCQTIWLPAR